MHKKIQKKLSLLMSFMLSFGVFQGGSLIVKAGTQGNDASAVPALGNIVGSKTGINSMYRVGSSLGSLRTVDFDVVPNAANINGTIGYAGYNAEVTSINDLGAAIKLNSSGNFEALNWDKYEAVNTVPYKANNKYNVNMELDMNKGTYDAYIKSPASDMVPVILNDNCLGFYNVYSKSEWLFEPKYNNTTDKKLVDGSFKRKNMVENVVYKLGNVNDFEVAVKYQYNTVNNNTKPVTDRYKLYVSSDNVNYTPIAVKIKDGSLNQVNSGALDSSAVLIPDAVMPDGMNFLKIETTTADTTVWSAQIDNVLIKGFDKPHTNTLKDDAADLTKVNSSVNIMKEVDAFNGITRFKRANADRLLPGSVVYKVDEITDFYANVWYNYGSGGANVTDILTRVKAYVSSDGVNYDPIALAIKAGTLNQSSTWNLDSSVKLIPAAAVPAGKNYVKFELVGNADAKVWSPAIDEVVVVGKEKPGVELLTDDAEDFTKTFSKSNWTIESGRFKRVALNENIVYKSNDISDFNVKLMYNWRPDRNNSSEVLDRVKFSVSADNITYTPIIAKVKDGTLVQQRSWNLDSSAVLVPSVAIPAGMDYLKIEVTEADTVLFSSQIDSVTITGAADPNKLVEQPYVQIADDYAFSAKGLKDLGKIVLSSTADNQFRVQNHKVDLYQVLNPTEDAYVQAGDTANKNFGKDQGIVVRRPDQRRGYLKFDLSKIKYPNSFAYELYLFANSSTHTKGNTTYVYGLEDDSWKEMEITFNNSPNPADLFTDPAKALDQVPMTKNDLYLNWTVTDFIKAQLAGDKTASLGVVGNDWEWTQFHSKEADLFWPELRAYHTAKEVIAAALAEAVALHDGAVEGSDNDQYEAGAKAKLKTAIDKVSAVNNNAGSSQSELLVASDDLQSSVNEFKLSRSGLRIQKIAAEAGKYILLPGETTVVSSEATLMEGTKLTAEQANISYSSSDESVLKASGSVITATGEGRGTVKVKAQYAKSTFNYDLPILVKRLTAEDITKVKELSGAKAGDSSYDVYMDVNRDGVIDSLDADIFTAEKIRADKMEVLTNDIAFMIGYPRASIGQNVKVINETNLQVAPLVIEGKKAIPAKFAAESLGADAVEEGNTLNITYAGKAIKLTDGSKTIVVDGTVKEMAAAAKVVNNTLMVEAEAFISALGKDLYTDDRGLMIITTVAYDKEQDSKYLGDLIFNISGERYWTYLDGRNSVDLAQIRKNLQLKTVTPAMVSEAFNKAGKANIHPRTVIDQAGIDRIKALRANNDPYIVGSINALIKRADDSVKLPKAEFRTDGLRYTTIHDRTVLLEELALAYIFTGQQKYFDKAWQDLEVILNFPDWNITKHALDTGVASGNIGVFFDLMYDKLTAEQKTMIQTAMIKNALAPGLSAMKARVWWSVDANNWTGVCNGGLMTGALALYDTDPKMMSEVVAAALNGMADKYIRAFEPAGQNEEGIMYWHYGLMYATIGFESALNVLGTDFGYSDTPGLRNTGYFPIYTSGPAAGLSIGDDPLKDKRSETKMWLAKRYNDAAIAALAYNPNGNGDWREFLFYDPALVQKGLTEKSAQAPLDNFMPGTDLIGFRSSWDHSAAAYVGIHGGRNNASHGHLDAGSFDVQANGQVWVNGGLGRDDYNFPGYFENNSLPGYEDEKTAQTSPGRWHFYMLRAEGKSALVINGDGQPDIRPDQNPEGVAVVERIESKPKGAYTILDLTDNYKRDVTSYKRGMMLSSDRKVITIQDEVTTKTGQAKVWWLANIKPDNIMLSSDGRSAVMYKGNEKMWVGLQSPASGRFKVMNATYLPGEEFPLTKNTQQSHKKLAVEFDNVGTATINVTFVPLNSWENAPRAGLVPEVKPMSQWTIEDGTLPENKVRPVLTDLKINGTTVKNFNSSIMSYDYFLAVDDETIPEIEGTSDANIEKSIDGNKVMILLTDKNDENNKNAYNVIINRNLAPSAAVKLDITAVTSSAVGAQKPGEDPRTVNPSATIDGNIDGTVDRWSAEGSGPWIQYDLGKAMDVKYLAIAYFNGHVRKSFFSVQTSLTGEEGSYTEVFNGASSGTTNRFEYYNLLPTKARYVKIIGYGNSASGWNSIAEVQIYRDKMLDKVNISLDKSEIRLQETANAAVTAELDGGVPADLSKARITFSSTDEKVAAVDSLGRILPRGIGTADITATVELNGVIKSATETITVINCLNSIEALSYKASISSAQTAQIKVSGIMDDGSAADLSKAETTYISSDENILKVDTSGKVIPVSAGTAEVKVIVTLGKVTLEKTVSIKVNSIKEVILKLEESTIKHKDSTEVEVKAVMDDGTQVDLSKAIVVYSSDNEAAAVVDSQGIVTGVKKGTASIKISVTLDGVTKESSVLISVVSYNVDKAQGHLR